MLLGAIGAAVWAVQMLWIPITAAGIATSPQASIASGRPMLPELLNIIGGASVYAEALPLVTKIHRTVIAGDFPEADAFMPKGWHDGFDLVDASTGDGPVAQYQTLVREQRRMA